MFPQLKKTEQLSETLQPNAIKAAVRAFVDESWDASVPFDRDGYYEQTLQQIISTVVMKTNPSATFWLAEDEDGSIAAWAITSVSVDVDNKLTFWGRDAWVSPRYRGSRATKHWFAELRREAVRLGCSHFVIPSSRGIAAYCRFLGPNWKPYISLIKEDL